MLSLTEELFLLSLADKKTSLVLPTSESFPSTLVAAFLVDLIYDGKLVIGEGRRILVNMESDQSLESPDGFLARIKEASRPKKINYWVDTFSLKGKKLYKLCLESLVSKKAVQKDDYSYTWVIPYDESSDPKSTAKFIAKEKLRRAVLATEELDDRSTAVFILLRAAGYLDHIFTIDEIRLASKKLDDLLKSSVGPDTGETGERSYSAIAAAVLSAHTEK